MKIKNSLLDRWCCSDLWGTNSNKSKEAWIWYGIIITWKNFSPSGQHPQVDRPTLHTSHTLVYHNVIFYGFIPIVSDDKIHNPFHSMIHLHITQTFLSNWVATFMKCELGNSSSEKTVSTMYKAWNTLIWDPKGRNRFVVFKIRVSQHNTLTKPEERLIKTWGGWRLNPSLPLRQIKHCIDIKYLQWWTSNFSISLSSILPPTIWSTCFICRIKYPEHYDGIFIQLYLLSGKVSSIIFAWQLTHYTTK